MNVEYTSLWDHAQDRQRTQYQLHSNRLTRKITAWQKYEKKYMPIVDALLSDGSLPVEQKADEPFNVTLWLPSKLGSADVDFDRRLAGIEWKLRIAEAYEALDELRHHIQLRTHVYKFKDQFTRGQAANTRALNMITTINTKINSNCDKYRAARIALVSLSNMLGEINWQSQLPILANCDVRSVSEGEEGNSEGRKTISWIWKVMGVVGEEEGDLHLRDCEFHCYFLTFDYNAIVALRIEWCKSRARAMRFTEEVQLLQEEMERTLRFFKWQESRWASNSQLIKNRMTISPMRAEGLQAYAERQAALRSALHNRFQYLWRNVSIYIKLVTGSIEM